MRCISYQVRHDEMGRLITSIEYREEIEALAVDLTIERSPEFVAPFSISTALQR